MSLVSWSALRPIDKKRTGPKTGPVRQERKTEGGSVQQENGLEIHRPLPAPYTGGPNKSRLKMNGLPYYKAYPRDFLEGTVGLSFELKGTYRLILDLIYMQAGRLPDDPRYIAGLLGCSVRTWNKNRTSLLEAGKIYAENGIISNFRADKELIISNSFQSKQRENRLGSNKTNDLTKTMVEPKRNHTDTDTDTDIKERVTKVTPKKLCVEDPLFDRFWNLYPRKVGKGQAQAAWKAAAKKVDPQLIIEGLQIHMPDLTDKPPQFIPHPATWLNGERWADQLEQHGDPFWDTFTWENSK